MKALASLNAAMTAALAKAHAAAAETDELHLGLSELHREWGDLDAAVRALTRAGHQVSG